MKNKTPREHSPVNNQEAVTRLTDLVREGACDMHLHTDASDGADSVAALIQKVIENKLRCFSITDHDNSLGIPEAIRILDQLRKLGLTTPRLIPGIELSAEEEGEIHILGYFPFGGYEKMEKYLTIQQNRRHARNIRMCELLTRRGMPIGVEELKSQPIGVAGKLHVANLLLRKGYVNSVKQAFEQWIGDDKPCFVQREKPSSLQAIRAISDAGGIPVLAHPFLYGWCSNTGNVSSKLIRKLAKLKKQGLVGAEAFHGEATYMQCLETRAAALTLGLISTVGSDYHGANKQGIKMLSSQDRFIRENERMLSVFICERGGKLLMVQSRSGLSDEKWKFPGFFLEEQEILESDPIQILVRRLGVEATDICHHSTQVFSEDGRCSVDGSADERERLVMAAYRIRFDCPEVIEEIFSGPEMTGWFRFSELCGLSLSRPDGALFDRLREIPIRTK
jgi:3',5'-nucleoside bisphosphate phosphatase